MKKFAKMSLVAAVAVAGLTGTASAADLSEAIKGVDVSGQFRLRYEDAATETSGATGTSANSNTSDVEIEVIAKVPVNDNVTAVFKIDNANDNSQVVATDDVDIEDYYFSYVNGAITANLGQQNIPGRFHFAKQGDGLVALYNAEAFTVGAAGFITNSITQQNDVYSVLAAGNIGPVSLAAQYYDVVDHSDGYHVKADATVGPVTAGVEYMSRDTDNVSANDDNETLKVYASGSIDALSLKVTYAATGKNDSGSLDGHAEAPAEFLLYQTNSANKDDFSVVAVDASYALTDTVSLRAAYADGDYKDETTAEKVDVTEILGQVSYKMSSNLNTYFRLSKYESDFKGATSDTEKVRGRIEVAYTF